MLGPLGRLEQGRLVASDLARQGAGVLGVGVDQQRIDRPPRRGQAPEVGQAGDRLAAAAVEPEAVIGQVVRFGMS